MVKILIAVDGSDHARRAIDAAGRLAREGAKVRAVLLNVRDYPRYLGDFPPLDLESTEHRLVEQQTALLDAAVARARAAGLDDVSTLACAGHAAQEIARQATEASADMVVMGTRGMTLLGDLVLGSVAQRVVHLVSIPVVLVR